MDSEILKPFLAGVARHALTTVGGYLVASGVIGQGEVSGFVGAGMVLAGVAWSWWNKKGQAQMAELIKGMTGKVASK